MYVYVPQYVWCPQKPEEVTGFPLGLELQWLCVALWLLGGKPEPSVRAVSAAACWVISNLWNSFSTTLNYWQEQTSLQLPSVDSRLPKLLSPRRACKARVCTHTLHLHAALSPGWPASRMCDEFLANLSPNFWTTAQGGALNFATSLSNLHPYSGQACGTGSATSLRLGFLTVWADCFLMQSPVPFVLYLLGPYFWWLFFFCNRSCSVL